MPTSKEQARQQVADLVARLQSLSASDLHRYNLEENTKKDFILPLFRALGWDVDNAAEVAAEENASAGRVDYAFKIGGVSRFFVEAKSMSATLTDPKFIKQAIEYALNRGVPWAVLTNFQELHLFYALGDAKQPDTLRWKTLRHPDYIAHFDDLWLLSRDSIESGATDEEAHRDGRLPPRLPIEQRLFRQLREWRETLTNQLLQYHENTLTEAQVDEVVERLFNRLIFIRTCEDRKIEDRLLWQTWQDWLNKRRRGSLVVSIRRIFDKFRDWYDSDLFPQTPHLLDQPALVHLDDSPLEEIIQGLYTIPGGYADYDFSLIDADVLGAVYEQYLGHVSQVASARTAQKARQLALMGTAQPRELVEKREKRKQQGIYYTPKWVVDFIVRQTVGRALDEAGRSKGAAEERLATLRVLDPACGSGSFLIRAYDELLQRAAALSRRPSEHVFEDERAEILRHNIFGVDLDPQAVDIARLNLMLRGLARRERLPSLAANVQVGNSLISGEEAELKPYFGDAWREKHPFNWEERFPQVMDEGGFDVVIGNPPYVRIQSLPREDADYYRKQFESAHGSFDIYVLFIERGLRLLKPGGRLGFITSGKFLKAQYGKRLQSLINQDATVETIVDLSAHQVFGDATTYPVLLVLRKGASKANLTYLEVPAAARLPETTVPLDASALSATRTPQDAVVKGVWPPQPRRGQGLWQKLHAAGPALGEIADIYVGLQTSADKVYVVDRLSNSSETGLVTVRSRQTKGVYELEPDILHPILVGSAQVHRWRVDPKQLMLLFPYQATQTGASLIAANRLSSLWPRIWRYLEDHRSYLEARERGTWTGEKWYGYVYEKNHEEFAHPRPRLLATSIAAQASFALDDDAAYFFTGGGSSGVYGITLKPGQPIALLYLLALLNSSALEYVLRRLSSVFRGGYFVQRPQYLRRLPIALPDRGQAAPRHVAGLAQRAIDLHGRIAAKGSARDNEREDLERAAARTDRAIDQAVYDLYGLTEAERRMVEGPS